MGRSALFSLALAHPKIPYFTALIKVQARQPLCSRLGTPLLFPLPVVVYNLCMETKSIDKKTLMGRIVMFAVIMIAIVLLMRLVVKASQATSKYDAFAQCLNQKGLKFYGAFWCPHCQAQKRRFGGAKKYLPYVECSTKDGKAQTQTCIDKKIGHYPTWEFPDGTRKEGEVELGDLSKISGCALTETPSSPASDSTAPGTAEASSAATGTASGVSSAASPAN
jgi:thiol-disulfide isomerase/thioredoxin